jgi:uncharacterized protein with PhoU and TrkA domain
VQQITKKHPWPLDFSEVVVPAGGAAVGRTLRELNLRRETGATIVALERGGSVHYDMPADLRLSPADHLLLVGEQAQLDAAETALAAVGGGALVTEALPHAFSRMLVTGASELCGLSLREAKVRAKFGVTIIGLQRGETRNTGPSPEQVLRDGDLLLVMGREPGIAALREALVG